MDVAWVTGTASKLDGRGFVPGDFDGDGDLDFVLVNSLQPLQYFENVHPNPGRWLIVRLRGTKSNSFGVGARVRVTAKGKTQTREIHLGSGYLSSPPPEAHFGLGEAMGIERIEVRWPSGVVQRVEGVLVNQVVTIKEGGSIEGVRR